MRDRTVTETKYDHPAPSSRPRVPGVLVVFAGAACAPVPWRVGRRCTVGRDASADLEVNDRGVSRLHAWLEPDPGGVLVTDNASRNGTYVDGVRVTTQRTPARFGAVLRMAKTLLIVRDDVVPFEGGGSGEYLPLVGGPSLADVRMRISMVADLPDPVLIEGETGTGKEVVAQVIHEGSGRVGRLVGLNCAAIAPEVVESELFGHARGAFSGSVGQRAGLFRAASGGTLLLDEIGELAPAMQAKLLRVLETGEVRGVGEDAPTAVDVRVLAATNRDLDEMVAAGTFRGDLFHRIAATRIYLPPLAARLEDVPMLAAHFLRESPVGLTAPALEVLLQRPWPGNVRELRNVLTTATNAVRKAGRDRVWAEDVAAVESSGPASGQEEPIRQRVIEALTASGGNVMRTARELGMARSALYEMLKRLRLNPGSFRRS